MKIIFLNIENPRISIEIGSFNKIKIISEATFKKTFEKEYCLVDNVGYTNTETLQSFNFNEEIEQPTKEIGKTIFKTIKTKINIVLKKDDWKTTQVLIEGKLCFSKGKFAGKWRIKNLFGL